MPAYFFTAHHLRACINWRAINARRICFLYSETLLRRKMAEAICGTEVTIDHIQEVLQKRFGTENKIAKHEASEIGVSKGFASKICQVKLTWENEEASLPTSLIAKIPGMVNFSKLLEGMSEDEKEKVMRMMTQLDVIKRVMMLY